MNVFLFCYWFNFILSFFSPDLEERIFKWVTSCFFPWLFSCIYQRRKDYSTRKKSCKICWKNAHLFIMHNDEKEHTKKRQHHQENKKDHDFI